VEPLSRFAEEPELAAILLDVDGTLAPIVPRPEDARVPTETQSELQRLHRRYALVACLSGRTAADAERVVGVNELVYVGNHGLELEPAAEDWREALHDFLTKVDWPDAEDNELSASLHFRNAADEESARAQLEAIAAQARRVGFSARFGRKVLEIVPPVKASKGTAVRRLLAERGLERALYAGDDTTDIDAFRALEELELGIRIAVASAEAPAELVHRADVVVSTPNELAALLSRL
jgi:trehalose 6-phosphate phosphatase